MQRDVVFVTWSGGPDLDADEAPLGEACSRLGLSWQAVPWDGPRFDWSVARMVVVRSPWNYSRQRDRFLDWARHAAAVTSLHNPLATLVANSEKSYLADLAAAGVSVVPTEVARAGTVRDLDAFLRERGWLDAVVKPLVSAGGWRTFRVRAGEVSHGAARARRLLATRDALIQPFLPAVMGAGERALVYLDGAFSHAVAKRSVFDDAATPFRTLTEPTPAELALGDAARRAAGAEHLLYARVDVVAGSDGNPRLMEIELTEPRLFLAAAGPAAAVRLAGGIASRLA